jgi:hypothetical protein
MSSRFFFNHLLGHLSGVLLLAPSLWMTSSIPVFGQAAPPVSGVVSRSGDNVLTAQDLEDLRVIDACVLDTPLSPVEHEQAQQNIVRQFQRAPAAFTKTEPANHQIAELLRHASLAERTELAMRLWAAWNGRAQVDPTVKWWVDLVRRHNPVIAQSGDLVVTRLQLNGLFADNDWVAKTAGLSLSTEASRAAFVRELPAKFAAMTESDKTKLARADVRWFDLHDPVLDHSDLQQIAVNEVHEHVHGPQDVSLEARNLEDVGVRFNNEMAQFTHNMAAISGLDFQTKSNINNLNFADRKFWGKGP